MNISVDLVKQLRDMTLASLKDCKDCLVEANGDIEQAKELLKKKWLASAMKKWDRETNEGKVSYLVQDGKIAVLKLGCETDFVANNDLFNDLIQRVLTSAIGTECVSFDVLDEVKKEELTTMVAEVVGKLGENMKIIELFVKKLPSSDVYVYTHAGSKLIAVVYYNAIVADATESVKKAALQIAAMDPTYLSVDTIPTQEIETMKTEFESEVKASGKPEAVIPNIVAWKLQKRYSETVLLEQGYVGDEAMKIKDIIANNATIVAFERVGFSS